jgi:tetratricopeptide (TPR) repeat protein
MTIIPLRAYNREIEGMIDNSQLDEAVAHCRHILATYPKYIASYRLLGKAHLEQQRISDATDIFQRVLSSVPDDFIANVGMSIIREDENNLDAAIWHMELAYESQPANVAIQDELRRLYGRRDGVQPPKVRLTRGALARMYAKGGLFDQAVAELRSAIAEDPNRPDLQLLLAEMYYQTEQRIDAVEACANIIKKIPYCLIANRILAISLSQAEDSEAVKNYQQITISLDPYYAFANPEVISSEQVPENAVNIERLEWKSGIQVEEAPAQPNWATSLGISIENQADENLPDWLKSAEAPELSSAGEKSGSSVSPFIWDTQEVENIISDTSKPEGEIPDWMKDAGWQPASGESTPPPEEGKSEEPLVGVSADEEIEKGELPDWLRGVAPESSAEESSQPEQPPEAYLSSPWLEQHQPGPTDSIIQWLDETKPETNVPPLSEDEDISAALDEEMPDWLKDLEVPATPSTQEGEPVSSTQETVSPPSAFIEEPSASEGLKPQVEQFEEKISPDIEAMPSTEDKSLPTVETSGSDEIIPPEAEAATSVNLPEQGETPQAEITESDSLESIEPEDLAAESIEEVPEWLRELAEEQPSPETMPAEQGEKVTETPSPELESEAQQSAAIEQSPLDEQETSAEEPPVTSAAFVTPDLEASEVPDKITPAAEEPTEEVSTSMEEQTQAETAMPSTMEVPLAESGQPGETDSLAWLDELTADQGDLEEPAPTTESAEGLPSEWVYLEPSIPPEESIQPETGAEEPIALPAEEIPDWIKGLGEESEGEEVVGQPEAEAEEVQPEMEAVAEQPEMEAVPEQPEAEVEEKQPETEAEGVQPEIEAVTEQPEMEAVLEQPEAEAEEKQPEMEAVAEQLEVEAASEQPEAEAEVMQPEMEAVTEQPEMEAVPEQPEAEAEEVQPEMEAVAEQLEVEVPPEQPDEEAILEEHTQEITPGEEITPEEELPAWLLELEEPEVEEETIASQEVTPEEITPEEDTEELPAWLQEITEAEPSSEAAGATSPVEAELPSEPLEEIQQPEEETSSVMGEIEEKAPEAISEPITAVTEDEESTQPETVAPVGVEVPDELHMEEQLPQEPEQVGDETEEAPSYPEVVTSQNQEVMAEARAFMDQEQPDLAVKAYDGLIRQNYQLDEIIQDLTEAVYHFPVNPEIWVSLGDTYFRKDQLQEALNAYTKAEELAR